MKNQWLPLLLLLPILLASCSDNAPKNVMGYAPIYNSDTGQIVITTLAPQATENGGKIYLKDQYCYQVEANKGIHIIDMSDPKTPKKLSFIQVLGAQEIAIKGHYLYTNSTNDLLIIDISNIHAAALQQRIANVYALVSSETPPEAGYFECVDPSKGKVVGWEKKKLAAPNCKL
jgi:hypothetical protein